MKILGSLLNKVDEQLNPQRRGSNASKVSGTMCGCIMGSLLCDGERWQDGRHSHPKQWVPSPPPPSHRQTSWTGKSHQPKTTELCREGALPRAGFQHSCCKSVSYKEIQSEGKCKREERLEHQRGLWTLSWTYPGPLDRRWPSPHHREKSRMVCCSGQADT
jgi:hypothetical protein